MAVVFTFEGSFVYDGIGSDDREVLARRLREKYGDDVVAFLKDWCVADDLVVEADGERVFGSGASRIWEAS